VDVRTKDSQGKTICPICNKHYIPDLPELNKNEFRCIQIIYPESKPYQREQLLTGICSDECWKKLFPEEEEEDDESCPVCGVFGCDGNCYPKPAGCPEPEEEEEE
jgi:hypothetical protein